MVCVSAVVGPAVKRLSRSRSSVTSIIERIAAVSSSEYLPISAPSLVAALKMRVDLGDGLVVGRHPARMRSSRCLTSVWSAITLPSSSR